MNINVRHKTLSFAFTIFFVFFLNASQSYASNAKCTKLLSPAYPKTISLLRKSTKEKIELLKQIQKDNLFIDFQTEDKIWDAGTVTKIENSYKGGPRDVVISSRTISPRAITKVRVLGKASKASQKEHIALMPLDLREEMALSTIPPQVFRIIKKNQGKIISALDFVKNISVYEGQILLGIDGPEYELFARIGGLYGFSESYDHYSIDPNHGDHTATFMEKITYYSRSVFLIPRSFFEYETPASREGSNITRKEFEWLMAHPGKLSRVTFVLGANNLIVEQPYSASDAHLKKVFRNPEKYLLISQ